MIWRQAAVKALPELIKVLLVGAFGALAILGIWDFLFGWPPGEILFP